MNLKESEVLASAIEFARANGISTHVVDVLFVVGRDTAGRVTPETDRWVVHFARELHPDVVMDPETIVVCVDDRTGEVGFFPAL